MHHCQSHRHPFFLNTGAASYSSSIASPRVCDSPHLYNELRL
jgi:hypothetical protein